MLVTLRKIESNHSNLRTPEVVGTATNLPEIGEPFIMYAPPIDQQASVRVIRTSPVVTVDGTRSQTMFRTENSLYELRVHE